MVGLKYEDTPEKDTLSVTCGSSLPSMLPDGARSHRCLFATLVIIINAASKGHAQYDPVPLENQVCGKRHAEGLDIRRLEPDSDKLQFARFGEFPWTVGILSNKREDSGEWNERTLQGAGSLIGPRAVLTAAHIVDEIKEDPLKVRAGEGHIESPDLHDYVESTVGSIIIHENYDRKTHAYDIALLILKDPIEIKEHIGYICLPEQRQKAPIKDECYSTGWGRNRNDGQIQSEMKKIKLSIIKRRDCKRALWASRLGPMYKLHRSVLCAHGYDGVDTCTGDGGAPLVCPIPNKEPHYKQFGIVSFGVGCGEQNVPGGYTDVADFRDWIDEQMSVRGFPTSSYVYSK